MLWTLEKDFRFEAAHRLTNHDGQCARLHGHSWRGKIIICGTEVHTEGPKQGMVVDYGDISKLIKPILEGQLDHWYLNETLPIYPTSENIAKWLFGRWADALEREHPRRSYYIEAVQIEETCTARCTYSE